jgi:outer membrane biosynthesis protein TonB
MKVSLATSLGLHVAILVAALVVLPNPAPHDVKPVEAIQVDITNIGEISKKMAMAKDAEKVVEKPAPKKTETVKKADPQAKVAEEVKKVAKEPKAEPPPPPEPKEKPKKEPPKEAEPKPLDSDPLKALIKETVEDPPPKKKEEPKKAEKKPEKKPDKKPDKKKEKLDLDQMEAFLNKIDDESTAPVESSQLDGAPTQGEANLQGTDDQLSATIIQALVQRIRECWVVPPGAREASIVVKLRFGINPDGTITGSPQIMNSSGDPLFDATARSAVAAVMGCQNYDFLPQDKYDLWKDLIINFNPNMMFDS